MEKMTETFLKPVCWTVRTGAPWRDLPPTFGPWKTVYNRYNHWVKKGHLDAILVFFKKRGAHEWHRIDGTIIRAHRHGAGAQGGQEKEGLGRSCGGFSSKIPAKVDALGMPLEFIIRAGQAADIGQAQAIIGEDACEYLLADRGYKAAHFRQYLAEKEMIPVIPGKKNRSNEVV